jgi:hypothetical protein
MHSTTFKSNVLINRIAIICTSFSLLISYFLIGHILNFLQYIIEFIIFSITPLKIALHISSTDIDLIQQMESNASDFNELKQLHKQSKKLMRIRSDYGFMLLRQIFVVSAIRMMIGLIPVLNFIPFMSLVTIYLRIGLLLLMILVQVPTTLINALISHIMEKFELGPAQLAHLQYPISDQLVDWVKNMISETKFASIRIIRDVLLKYDNNDVIDPSDNENLISALNNLGIKKELLSYIKIDLKTINNIFTDLKASISSIIITGYNSISTIFTNNDKLNEPFKIKDQ